jgi:hypothetical protein
MAKPWWQNDEGVAGKTFQNLPQPSVVRFQFGSKFNLRLMVHTIGEALVSEAAAGMGETTNGHSAAKPQPI